MPIGAWSGEEGSNALVIAKYNLARLFVSNTQKHLFIGVLSFRWVPKQLSGGILCVW
jgi:hypothetical protein